MKVTASIRYVSGRSEKYEIEFWGGVGAKGRLEAFLKSPNLALRTDNELIIIPGSAIECISIPVPEEAEPRLDLGAVRPAKRVE